MKDSGSVIGLYKAANSLRSLWYNVLMKLESLLFLNCPVLAHQDRKNTLSFASKGSKRLSLGQKNLSNRSSCSNIFSDDGQEQ